MLSFLEKSNYGDIRTLEIANKRLTQYQGIIGMSDQMMGNFGADVTEVIRANARHKHDIQREFQQTLSENRAANESLVDAAESVLFTSFTNEVAKTVAVTPKYMEEKIAQMNTDLWDITAQFLAEHGYLIDVAAQTATLPDNAKPDTLFYYWTGSRNTQYKGLRRYGAGKDFKPVSGRITLTSPIGRGVLHNVECADTGNLLVNGDILSCQIGFYLIDISNTPYTAFVGKADGEQVLMDSDCRKIMTLPALSFVEGEHKSAAWLRNSTGGTKFHELDRLLDAELFIGKQLENRSTAQNEEITRMREASNRKKAELERSLNAIRGQLKAAQSKADGGLSRHEMMKVERETALLIKRIKDTEKSLHYDKMKLEQELRAEVEAFLGKSKMTEKIYRQFVLHVNGGNASG